MRRTVEGRPETFPWPMSWWSRRSDDADMSSRRHNAVAKTLAGPKEVEARLANPPLGEHSSDKP